mmetsp:Transcript_68158/g.138636  ORF Transcript_68158/g.138636 Transcript_68158/m.138636 type:complete len:326 (+) Transcript_68158:801-1778(+)
MNIAGASVLIVVVAFICFAAAFLDLCILRFVLGAVAANAEPCFRLLVGSTSHSRSTILVSTAEKPRTVLQELLVHFFIVYPHRLFCIVVFHSDVFFVQGILFPTIQDLLAFGVATRSCFAGLRVFKDQLQQFHVRKPASGSVVSPRLTIILIHSRGSGEFGGGIIISVSSIVSSDIALVTVVYDRATWLALVVIFRFLLDNNRGFTSASSSYGAGIQIDDGIIVVPIVAIIHRVCFGNFFWWGGIGVGLGLCFGCRIGCFLWLCLGQRSIFSVLCILCCFFFCYHFVLFPLVLLLLQCVFHHSLFLQFFGFGFLVLGSAAAAALI